MCICSGGHDTNTITGHDKSDPFREITCPTYQAPETISQLIIVQIYYSRPDVAIVILPRAQALHLQGWNQVTSVFDPVPPVYPPFSELPYQEQLAWISDQPITSRPLNPVDCVPPVGIPLKNVGAHKYHIPIPGCNTTDYLRPRRLMSVGSVGF